MTAYLKLKNSIWRNFKLEIATIVVSLCVFAYCQAGPYLGLIAANVGISSVKRYDTPTPKPVPKVPRNECTECNGTGWVGDGTVRVPCGNCYENNISEGFGDSSDLAPPPSGFRYSKGEFGIVRRVVDGKIVKSKKWVPEGGLLRTTKRKLNVNQGNGARAQPQQRRQCFT